MNATFRPLAVEGGLAFAVDVADDAPREMYSDEQRLQQILRNLLSNAIKFTSAGRVTLRVERARGRARCATSATSSRSPSRTPASASRRTSSASIFEAFEQAHTAATSPTYGGTGLGLSISRELAALLGGRIVGRAANRARAAPSRCTSRSCTRAARRPAPWTPPRTSTQPSRLRRRDDAMDWAADRDHVEPATTMTRLGAWNAERADRKLPGKVLIVDDDIRIVLALTKLLGRVGMPALYAMNGREGLEVLEHNPDVSLVLIDIMMPVMDGYEAIKAIRRIPSTPPCRSSCSAPRPSPANARRPCRSAPTSTSRSPSWTWTGS